MRKVRLGSAIWASIVSALAGALVAGALDRTSPAVSYAAPEPIAAEPIAAEALAESIPEVKIDRFTPKIYRLEGKMGESHL